MSALHYQYTSITSWHAPVGRDGFMMHYVLYHRAMGGFGLIV